MSASSNGRDKSTGRENAAFRRGLTYVAPKTPSFLAAFQAQLQGGPAPSSAQYSASRSALELGDGDQRAALPERGARQTSEEREEEERLQELEGDDLGWGEGGDDAPQVVVLKEGKHLSKEDIEDERRIAKGLPPLHSKSTPSDPSRPTSTTLSSKGASSSKTSSNPPPPKTNKRKAMAVGQEAEDGKVAEEGAGGNKKKKEKKVKEKKGLLSFDEDV